MVIPFEKEIVFFQILETYGFEADFRRKDLVGQLELAPPSVEKFLRKLGKH